MASKQPLIITEDSDPYDTAEMQNTLPEAVLNAMNNLPLEYLDMAGEELTAKANPSYNDEKVKVNFWKMFKSCSRRETRMSIKNIVMGYYGKDAFYERIGSNPAWLAWLLTPVESYAVNVETLLNRSVDRYKELVDMDIMTTRVIRWTDEDGEKHSKTVKEVDAKKAAVLLQVIKNLEERAHGSSIHRQISVNTSEPTTDKENKSELDMDKVNQKLLELERKLGNASDSEVIDVEASEIIR